MAETRQLLAGIAVVVVFAAVTLGVVGLVALGAREGSEPTPPPPSLAEAVPPATSTTPGPSGALASDPDLHADSNMTRYMSSPGASGPMFTGQVIDPQFRHSQDPAFVRELERHQQEMDRMLGRGQP